MRIQTSGYYRSQALPWEEWHGGALLSGSTTQFWRFFSDNLWVGCNREDPQFQFWQFSETLDSDRVKGARTRSTGLTDRGEELFRAGVYRIEGSVLTVNYELHLLLYPSGEQVHLSQWCWTIAHERLIPVVSASTAALQSYELEFFPCL